MKEYWVKIRENGQIVCWEFFGKDKQDALDFMADENMVEKWGKYNMFLEPVNEGEIPVGAEAFVA